MTDNIVSTYTGEFPEGDEALYRAAMDPLTPVSLLRELYELNDRSIISDLISNPSLPLDILNELINSEPVTFDTVLVRNPNLTLNQIKNVTREALYVDADVLDDFDSVVKIFDWLVTSGYYKKSYIFTSALLCNPHISAADFNVRVERHALILDDGQVYEDARFDMSNTRLFCKPRLEILRALLHNPSISPELFLYFLGEANECNGSTVGLSNLKCPIELSASYHIDNLDDYKWSPSYLIKLQAKVNERLNLLSSETNWDEIPLLWKLRMVAE